MTCGIAFGIGLAGGIILTAILMAGLLYDQYQESEGDNVGKYN